MHVIWKRPDGFHGAEPHDFFTVELSNHSKLWLHRSDRQWYPFRVSGGWQDSEATKKLNLLVNLLQKHRPEWIDALLHIYNNTFNEEPKTFIDEMQSWLAELLKHLKGDTWEQDIMSQAIQQVCDTITQLQQDFLQRAKLQSPSA